MGKAQPDRNYNLEVTAMAAQAAEITEVTDGNQQIVIDLGAAMNKLAREIDAERKETGEPHRAALKAIQDTFKPMLDVLETHVDRLKRLFGVWKQKLADAAEAKRLELAAVEAARQKAAAEAEATGQEPEPAPPIREVAPPPPQNVARGAFGKATGRKVWKAEVTDLPLFLTALLNNQIPILKLESVLTVNLETLKTAARLNHKFDPSRHGIRTWQEEEQAFS